MTTIAWDGKTLAADSRATSSGMPYKAIKIFRLDDGAIFAGSGDYGQVCVVKDWVECSIGKSRPVADDFAGLYVAANGEAYRLESSLIMLPLHEQFHAIGSGRDFAMAAMHCGRSAREAVEIAAIYDVFTGGDVMSFDVAGDG
jgi:20S proteasome alpha/beta subunit